MTGERVCVRTHEVGSTPTKFSSSYTLESVALWFHHDRSSGFIGVKTTGEGGLFAALPLNTELARLRDEGDLEGDGSWDNSYIVRVERAVTPELAGSAVLVAAVQELGNNITAKLVDVCDSLEQLAGLAEQVDMSAVSQGTATALLQTLGLQLVILSMETAIQVEGLRDVLAALPRLRNESEAEFKMERYPGEAEATLPFQEHLEEQLRQLCGSQWNRWAVEDIRSKKLSWLVAKKLYTGFQDLGIFPASASMDSLAQLRMGFELKHTEVHKQLYKKQAKAEAKLAAEAEKRAGELGRSAPAVARVPVAAQPLRQSERVAGRAAPEPPTEPPSSQAVPGVAWDKRVKGQSILELLCNYRVCEWPLDLVVTDGRAYHTLRLRGNDVQVVLNLSAMDGLHLIAARLLQIDPSPTFPAEAVAARKAFRFIGSPATSSSQQAASGSQQRAGAASGSQQRADAASGSQQRADAASGSQQQADAVSRTMVMWEQIQELASLVAPEDRPALIETFFQNNPERVYEVPAEIQAMHAF